MTTPTDPPAIEAEAINLESLAVRVEAAGGPDRELDAIIYEQVLGECIHEGVLEDAGSDDELELISVCRKCGKRGNMAYRVFRPTSSIDSALTLVPWDWLREWNYLFTLEQERDGRWTARADQMGDECGHGDTIMSEPCAEKALATTAFAIRARAHQLNESSPAQPDRRDK